MNDELRAAGVLFLRILMVMLTVLAVTVVVASIARYPGLTPVASDSLFAGVLLGFVAACHLAVGYVGGGV